MSTQMPTELPGDKLRKAVSEFSELVKKGEKTRGEILDIVARKYDLSPLESDFLLRQLKDG